MQSNQGRKVSRRIGYVMMLSTGKTQLLSKENDFIKFRDRIDFGRLPMSSRAWSLGFPTLDWFPFWS